NGTPLQNLTYSYDGDGNILTVSDGVDSTRDLWFGYDGLNRLTTASSPNTNYGNITFEYSPSGNITYNSRVGSYSYSGPQPHAVTAAGSNAYGYDANGNMTTRNGQAMTYDQENRLLKAGSYSYVYNYKGMRAIKSSGTPSSTTAYVNNLYECTNATCTKHIFAGSRRIASKTGSSVIYYYHPDLLGGLNIATDANGNPAETRFYYPYGEDWIATGSVDLHYKFTDQESDSETALYYYKARYYDPHIGRFITTDPLLQAVYDPATFPRLTVSNYLPSAAHIRGNKATGKAVSTQKNRTGTNPYTYALNNPTALIDPTGLDVNIIINRTTYTPSSIVGTINVTSTVVNGTFSGYTLENATPPNPNLPLPQGTYSAFSTNGTVLTQGRIALEVPDSINDLSKGYIEIHTGNEPDDATGCFVVGTTTTTDWVGNSRVAMDSINSIIAYDGSGKIMVYVTGSSTAPEAAPNSAPDNPTLTSPPQQDTLTQGSQEQVIPAPPPSSNPGPGPGSGDDYNDDDDDG
ncbi:MAG TPA: DUF5675 family protein, partial [Syntrophobacteraceae bacterium]|nr:DUF5675 family protein [Syntrophobacteraceae bacterium]